MRVAFGDVHPGSIPDSESAPDAHSNGRERWRRLISALDWQALGAKLRLSPQEVQVTRAILNGHKLTAIAAELRLGLGTVKTYCQRVHQKLGVRDPRELAIAVLAAYVEITSATGDETDLRLVKQLRPSSTKRPR